MHGAPNVPPAWSIGFGFAEIGFVDLLQNYSGSWNAEQWHPIRAPLEGRESIACKERPRGLRWLTPHNPAQVQGTWKRNNHHKIPSKVIRCKDKAQA